MKRFFIALFFYVILPIMALEFASAVYLKFYKDKVKEATNAPLHTSSSPTGYELVRNTSIRSVRTVNGDTVFDVLYKTDLQGRRIVPLSDSTSNRREFVAFFGCSRLFGHGLNDTQTLPYYFQSIDTISRVYNYAVQGFGTNSVFMQLRSRQLHKEIPQPNGIGIYQLTLDHIFRTIITTNIFNAWGEHMPYFTLDGDSLINRGPFDQANPLQALLFRLMLRSRLLQALRINFRTNITDQDIVLVCKLIEGMSQRFNEQFPNGKFYVVYFPPAFDHFGISGKLKKKNIRVIDMSHLYQDTLSTYSIPRDGHPSSVANELMARALYDSLAIRRVLPN